MALNTRALALAGAVVAATVFAAPATAASLAERPAVGAASAAFDYSRFDPETAIADWRRCRWGCGWGRGWGPYRGYRRNRIDGGDVLIGAAIIGGAIAIANSNNRRQRTRDVVIVDREVRDPDRRYDDRRYDDRRTSAPRGTGASGLDNAVDQCLDRIERDVRVDSVENVERTGAGWRVTGVLFNGAPFLCRIDNTGRIDGIDYGVGNGGGFSGSSSEVYTGGTGRQWNDQRYADARLAMGTAQPQAAAPQDFESAPPRNVTTDRMPAYPGGPIPGEDIPETIDGDL